MICCVVLTWTLFLVVGEHGQCGFCGCEGVVQMLSQQSMMVGWYVVQCLLQFCLVFCSGGNGARFRAVRNNDSVLLQRQNWVCLFRASEVDGVDSSRGSTLAIVKLASQVSPTPLPRSTSAHAVVCFLLSTGSIAQGG